MADPVAVLVVPAEGDPGGLLAGGAFHCGAKPPRVWHDRFGWRPASSRVPAGVRIALPLWWDGALVPEGWDRARRVWWDFTADYEDATDLQRAWGQIAHRPTIDVVRRLVAMLTSAGLASRVVLLDRADGRLVERP